MIHSVHHGYRFWGRPSVDDLRRDLRATTAGIRPGRDLTTSGLREVAAQGTGAVAG